MKMKNLVLSVCLAIASTATLATESTVVVRAGSDLIYRGADVTESHGTLGLGLLFDDVLLNGVYVSGDFDTIDVTPLTGNVTMRSDVQVGYTNSYNEFDYSVSLARVLNPVNYVEDYTELRARGQYSYFYGEVGQGISDGVNSDTYFSVGIEGRPFWDSLLLGASSSIVSYDNPPVGDSNVEWNNFEVYGSYDVWRELDLDFGYSVGGDTPVVDLGDHFWLGAKYTF